jgi:hypothetical protein
VIRTRHGVAVNESGAALVEIAICLAMLALVSLGITDIARGYVLTDQARSAAGAAALYAAAHPGQLHDVPNSPCADPENAAWQGSNAGGGAFQFTFSPDHAVPTDDCDLPRVPDRLAAPQRVKVTARATLSLSGPLVGDIIGSRTVSATACADVGAPPATVPCS